MKCPRLLTEVLDQHIRMPGVPQLIVTRRHAYRWLKENCWFPTQTGFGSLDYRVFGAPEIDEPLTDEGIVADLLRSIQ